MPPPARGIRNTGERAMLAEPAQAVASTSACSGRRRSRLARRAQLELDVVGVAEDQNQDPERLTKVTHLAVWDAARVEQTHSVLEHLGGRHRKAHMVEPYAILAEAVTLDGARWIRKRPDAEPHRPVAQEGAGVEVHKFFEAEETRVERDRTLDVGDGEPKVVNPAGRNEVRHGRLLWWPGI